MFVATLPRCQAFETAAAETTARIRAGLSLPASPDAKSSTSRRGDQRRNARDVFVFFFWGGDGKDSKNILKPLGVKTMRKQKYLKVGCVFLLLCF